MIIIKSLKKVGIRAVSMLLVAGISFHAYSSAGGQQLFEKNWIAPQVVMEKFGADIKNYHSFKLNTSGLLEVLNTLPLQGDGFNIKGSIELITPLGDVMDFNIYPARTMEEGLAVRYPQIKTFRLFAKNNSLIYGSLEVTDLGVSAMVINGENTFFIEPVEAINSWICEAPTEELGSFFKTSNDINIGNTLRTYRMALACTGEYAGTKGGTKSGALSGMVKSINRVNTVYEADVAIHFNLIANTDTLIYLNGATDPYTNSNGGTMLGENQSTIDNIIGSANYDIGHVFSTGGGGIAAFQSVCKSSLKARGVTGSPSPNGDSFDIDFVAHEIGHQFGGSHTFNSTSGGCGGGNRDGNAAYEIGSGVTIMGYAGLCGGDNIMNNSIPYFHIYSIEQIVNYSQFSTGNSCATRTTVVNNIPSGVITGNYIIPRGTPFILKSVSEDLDGDKVFHSIEQFNTGPAGTATSPTLGAPLFRNFTPVENTFRVFPKIADVLANRSVKGEVLPNYERIMNFKLVLRDNHAGCGGVFSTPEIEIVVDSTGPFSVTSYNVKDTLTGNGNIEITWDVKNTFNDPINCKFVNILLSTDGGVNFTDTLAMATPNDGIQVVRINNKTTNRARFKIESVGNIFFDINNVDIKLDPSLAGVGVKEVASTRFRVYPNPASQWLNIEFKSASNTKNNIQIHTIIGSKVYDQVVEMQGNNSIQVPVSQLPPGIYIVRINGESVKINVE